MVNKLLKLLTLENGIKGYLPCRDQKTNYPYRGQTTFSYLAVRAHQNKLEVCEREGSEVVASFSKR